MPKKLICKILSVSLVFVLCLNFCLVSDAFAKSNTCSSFNHSADGAIKINSTIQQSKNSNLYQNNRENNTITPANKDVEDIFNRMSMDDRVCQLLMVHIHQWQYDGQTYEDATKVDASMAEVFRKYHYGGFVLFGQNTKTTENTLNFVKDLQTCTTESGGLPLIMTPDQEGGVVFRLNTGTSCAGNMAIGATQDIQASYNSGDTLGSELNSVGINGNLAPCIDVNSNAGNPIIGLRSFGDNRDQVKSLGSAFMKALENNKVVACAKHFPGHGDVAEDSHVGLPVNNKTREELLSSDIVPFKQCIDDGLSMIMSAHIQYPNIDNTLLTPDKPGMTEKIITPATLSKIFMTDILRNDLGFDGVSCTDALTMQGIAKYFTKPTAVILSLEAGNDMIAEPVPAQNASEYISQTQNIINAVNEWVCKDLKNQERFEEAVKRVIKLKINSGIIDYNPDDYSLNKANQVLRSSQNLATEYEDTAKSITMIKNNEDLLPIKLNENSKVLYLTQNSTSSTNGDRHSTSSFAIAWNRLKKNKLIPNNIEPVLHEFNKDTSIEDLKPYIDSADYVICDSGVNSNALMGYLSWQSDIPNKIVEYAHSKEKKSVVLSVRLPYDCQLYPNADAILCSYNYVGTSADYIDILSNNDTTANDLCGPSLIEAVETVFGNINPKGKLPVNVPEFNYDKANPGYLDNIIYPNGYGLSFSSDSQLFNIDNLSVSLEYSNINYDGSVKCPKVSISTNPEAKVTYLSSTSNSLNKSFTVPVAREDKTFTEGKDYDVTYTNNTNPGQASVTITGKGNIIGSTTINFDINSSSALQDNYPAAQTNDELAPIVTALSFVVVISILICLTALNSCTHRKI